jgi:hypothetical protein
MTTKMNQISSRLDQTGVQTALVRSGSPPARPPDTVTVAPGISGSVGPDGRSVPFYVTAQATSGQTIREYDGEDTDAAADCAADLIAERNPRAVWLCGRDQIRSWWSEGIADLLERRLREAAHRVDARLVVWTSEGNEAVGDRYDVVLDR